MAKKNVPIKYTSRDFESIKQDLVEHAKRYYPNSFRDFNEAGFGALMLDTVAYVGDILSFYLDYQVNESFLNTAVEYENVVRLAQQLGYEPQLNPTTYGVASLYILVPASTTGPGPDANYLPILAKGAVFGAGNGATFSLTEDVNFAADKHQQVLARVDPSSGAPTYYAIRADAAVVSGQFSETSYTIGGYRKFLTLKVPSSNVTEIVSIVDSDGHEYYEVDNLSQETVYVEIPNRSDNTDTVTSILKPFPVPRRFVSRNTPDGMEIQFGHGSPQQLQDDSIVDPSSVVMKQHSRNHVTDSTFDPSSLTKSRKFGVAPANTTLYVTYRQNSTSNMNVGVNSLEDVLEASFSFNSEATLTDTTRQAVIDSLEVGNEQPILGDITTPLSEEIKIRAKGFFAAQSRIVTKGDYVSYVYNMPEKFGAVKRANIVADSDSFKRNLNLYVISENNNQKLVSSNSLIKQNLKTWINKNKMIHDTVDILDAKIVNLGIDYIVVVNEVSNKFDVLNNITDRLKDNFLKVLPDIGESFDISAVYSLLNSVPGVVDTVDVLVSLKSGGTYSDVYYDVEGNTSFDGRLVEFPEDYIWEVKFPNTDIKGSVQ